MRLEALRKEQKKHIETFYEYLPFEEALKLEMKTLFCIAMVEKEYDKEIKKHGKIKTKPY